MDDGLVAVVGVGHEITLAGESDSVVDVVVGVVAPHALRGDVGESDCLRRARGDDEPLTVGGEAKSPREVDAVERRDDLAVRIRDHVEIGDRGALGAARISEVATVGGGGHGEDRRSDEARAASEGARSVRPDPGVGLDDHITVEHRRGAPGRVGDEAHVFTLRLVAVERIFGWRNRDGAVERLARIGGEGRAGDRSLLRLAGRRGRRLAAVEASPPVGTVAAVSDTVAPGHQQRQHPPVVSTVAVTRERRARARARRRITGGEVSLTVSERPRMRQRASGAGRLADHVAREPGARDLWTQAPRI